MIGCSMNNELEGFGMTWPSFMFALTWKYSQKPQQTSVKTAGFQAKL
jgi:hypothetical protein